MKSISWSVVVACNSEKILKNTLLSSEELKYAQDVHIQRNADNASVAYNSGMDLCKSDIVVFIHQDVFLPDGWGYNMISWISELTKRDPKWGVVGVFGVTPLGQRIGHVYSTGLNRLVGNQFSDPMKVRVLDEMILILRRSSGLFFDERLPGFHLYGADICIQAEAKGMVNYVIPCFALHNSCGLKWLPKEFWRAYLYLERKWHNRLPIITPCTIISKNWPYVILRDIVGRIWATLNGRNNLGYRVDNPNLFYRKQVLYLMKEEGHKSQPA